MGTALIYLLVIAAVAAAVFGVAALLFGRGEELAPLPPGATPTRLPSGEILGNDVRELRFQQVVRGYRMDEVDWALGRLADELDRTATERDELVARLAELDPPAPTETAGPGAAVANGNAPPGEPAPDGTGPASLPANYTGSAGPAGPTPTRPDAARSGEEA